jgi:hypothetical protein
MDPHLGGSVEPMADQLTTMQGSTLCSVANPAIVFSDLDPSFQFDPDPVGSATSYFHSDNMVWQRENHIYSSRH